MLAVLFDNKVRDSQSLTVAKLLLPYSLQHTKPVCVLEEASGLIGQFIASKESRASWLLGNAVQASKVLWPFCTGEGGGAGNQSICNIY